MILDFLPSLLVQDLNIFPIVRTGPDSRGLMKYIFEQDCSYLFTRTGLTASVLPGWDNLSSRCTP